jgi:hypothetical protein
MTFLPLKFKTWPQRALRRVNAVRAKAAAMELLDQADDAFCNKLFVVTQGAFRSPGVGQIRLFFPLT